MSTSGSPSSYHSTTTTITTTTNTTWSKSHTKARNVIDSLTQLLGPIPESLSSSSSSSTRSLLHDPVVGAGVTTLLRRPYSGAGDDNLCRWLYDTFHTSDPDLQLVVLRFVPTLCGVYLTRALGRKPVAGFEAVLLAIYAHETKDRAEQPIAVRVPDLSHPSLYHESTKTNAATPVHIAVVSPALEPHGTVRATKRARIVGVALELYLSKISLMPAGSKIEFCEVCIAWAGQDGDMFKSMGMSDPITDDLLTSKNKPDWNSTTSPSKPHNSAVKNTEQVKQENVKKGGRIPLPWELLQPSLRILSHCLLGPAGTIDLKEAAHAAIRSLYARALHDMNSQAILATGSLLRLRRREPDPISEIEELRSSIDYPESGHIVFTPTTSGRSSA